MTKPQVAPDSELEARFKSVNSACGYKQKERKRERERKRRSKKRIKEGKRKKMMAMKLCEQVQLPIFTIWYMVKDSKG